MATFHYVAIILVSILVEISSMCVSPVLMATTPCRYPVSKIASNATCSEPSPFSSPMAAAPTSPSTLCKSTVSTIASNSVAAAPASALSGSEHPAAAANNTSTVCATKTWRDRIFFFDHLGFAAYMVYTVVSWYIIVCCDVEDRKQSYYYLVTMMLSMIPAWFYPIANDSIWNQIKFYIGLIVSALCAAADSAAYGHYGHTKWNILFLLLATAGAVAVPMVGSQENGRKTLSTILPILSKSSNIGSALVFILGFLLFPSWSYVRLEVHAAGLGLLYTISSIIDTCDTVNTYLVGAAIIARVVYAGLILTHHETRGIALWGCHNLLTSSRRKFTPFKDTMKQKWASLKEYMGRKINPFHPVVKFILGQLARFHVLPEAPNRRDGDREMEEFN